MILCKGQEEVGALECNHRFHTECLREMVMRTGKITCPMCRQPSEFLLSLCPRVTIDRFSEGYQVEGTGLGYLETMSFVDEISFDHPTPRRFRDSFSSAWNRMLEFMKIRKTKRRDSTASIHRPVEVNA